MISSKIENISLEENKKIILMMLQILYTLQCNLHHIRVNTVLERLNGIININNIYFMVN